MITFRQLGRYGQMGNQLFQYAALKGISAKTGFPVVIPDRFERRDLSIHGKYDWLSLRPFQLECTVMYVERLDAQRMRFFHEPKFTFCSEVFKQPDNTDFHGFFQSPKYFAHIEDDIRREFRLVPEMVLEAQDAMEAYRKQHPSLVSLHVRLSDNIRSSALGHNYLVKLPYYKRAVRMFPNAKFLVFSDNPWLCRRVFDSPRFIIHQPRLQWVDMAMISMCDHHINAASTFSWWAAWLDAKKDAITVVPKRWFGDKLKQNETVDLIPPDWIQLDDD